MMERIAVYAFFATLGIALVQIAIYLRRDFFEALKDEKKDFAAVFYRSLIYFATFIPILALTSVVLFMGVITVIKTRTVTSSDIVSFILTFVLSGVVSFCISMAKDKFGIGRTCCSPVLFVLCILVEAALVGFFLDWGIFAYSSDRSRPIFIPLFFR